MDTVSEKLLTVQTQCRCSRWLHGPGARELVGGYTDTTMTMQTIVEKFEGFPQILKEQSGVKSTWVYLHTQ